MASSSLNWLGRLRAAILTPFSRFRRTTATASGAASSRKSSRPRNSAKGTSRTAAPSTADERVESRPGVPPGHRRRKVNKRSKK